MTGVELIGRGEEGGKTCSTDVGLSSSIASSSSADADADSANSITLVPDIPSVIILNNRNKTG